MVQAALHRYRYDATGRAPGHYHWRDAWMWLWDNEIDGIDDPTNAVNPTWWDVVYWSGLRNSVNNFRFVPGVSKVGRPLFYRTWTIRGKEFYFKAGWMSNGYPALSAGAGRGY